MYKSFSSKKERKNIKQAKFLRFQLHLTATGFDLCDDSDANNTTSSNVANETTSPHLQPMMSSASNSSTTVFDGVTSPVCDADFASSFPDVSVSGFRVTS